MENILTNIAIPVGIILVLICTVLFIVSMVAGILQNVKGSSKLLIGVGVVLAIFFIAFTMSSDANPTSVDLSAANVKFITAGILTMAILIVLTFVIAIGTAIYDALK
ncbi:MAG: hypothetical protein ACK4IY_05260 [Chitinophagales bacterium]